LILLEAIEAKKTASGLPQGLRAKTFCSFFFIIFPVFVRAAQKGSLARCESKIKKTFDKSKNKMKKICSHSSLRAKKSHFRRPSASFLRTLVHFFAAVPLARTSPAHFDAIASNENRF